VDLLRDAGVYGTIGGNPTMSEPMLKTAMGICQTIPDSLAVRRQLCNIMAGVQQTFQNRGTAGRIEALQMARRIRELRYQEMQGIPRDQWAEIDVVNFGRGNGDLGCALMQLNMVEEAKARFEEGIELYSQYDNLKVRLFHARSLHVRTLAIMQKKAETREQAEATIDFIERELGRSNYLTLQTKSYSGHALFTIGDLDRSCELHKDMVEQYLQVDGNNADRTLGSRYCLAVCLQRKGLLQEARYVQGSVRFKPTKQKE
jgi:tetratricopeptide (TPR) repeat protein